MKTFSWAISAAASFSLAACGGNTLGTPGGTTGTASTASGGSGTSSGGTTPIDYPVPPTGQEYGIAVGNTFPNVALNGGAIMNLATTSTLDCPNSGNQKDVCTTSSPNFVPSFTFQDLYFAGKAAPQGQSFRYAFIDISGAWCPHCQQEASDLPGTIAKNGPGYVSQWLSEGGIVFSIIVQNFQENGPATPQNLFTWIGDYQINYPISIDSDQNMVTTTGIRAWPGNVIVRLNDMQVIESVLGAGSGFYLDFSKHLTDCQNDPTIANDCWAGASCQANSQSSTGYSCVAN